MRYAVVAVMIGLWVAVAPAPANGQSAGATTMSQAVAQLGTPSYDRNCADGSITLAWKDGDGQDRPRAQLQPARAYTRRGIGSSHTGRRTDTRVMKFDAAGGLVWTRLVH
jgi:hypothetical protein